MRNDETRDKHRTSNSADESSFGAATRKAGVVVATSLTAAAAAYSVLEAPFGWIVVGIIFLVGGAVFVSNVGLDRLQQRLPRLNDRQRAVSARARLALLALLSAALGILLAIATREEGPPCQAEEHIRLRYAPSAITSGKSGIWVASHKGRLFRIDPSSRDASPAMKVRRYVGPQPFDIAEGRGAIWVTGSGRLLKFDPRQKRKVWVKTYGESAGEVEVGLGAAWYKDYGRGVVIRLDSNDGKRIGTPLQLPRGTRATAFTLGKDAVWVTSDSSDAHRERLFKFSPDGKLLAKIKVHQDPQDLIALGQYVFVNHAVGQSIRRVDVRAMREDPEPALMRGALPSGIAADGDSLWVPGADTNSVDRINTNEFEGEGRCAVGRYPTDVAVSAGRAWVASQEGKEVTVVRTTD